MKKQLLFCWLILGTLYSAAAQSPAIAQIDQLLNAWHQAAAQANAKAYFGAMSDDAVYIGTDAGENWTKKQFQAFAQPYFDRGKAWDFKPLQRHIYLSPDGKTAWFDELLDTWMKICRGSGVLQKEKGQWKIKHYVLSTTVPNELIDSVVKTKTLLEDQQIQRIKQQKQP